MCIKISFLHFCADINPSVAAISYPLAASAVAGFNIGVANPAAFTYQTLVQPTVKMAYNFLCFTARPFCFASLIELNNC